MKLFKIYSILAIGTFMALNVTSCDKLDDSFALDKMGNPDLAPSADFTASATSIFQFESINFAPTEINEGDLYSWTFTGGSPSSSSDPSVTVKYSVRGTYQVSLKIRNEFGANEVVKEGFITVEGEPLDPAVRVRFNFEQNLFEEYSEAPGIYGGTPAYEAGKVNDFAFAFDGSNSITVPGYTGVNGTADRTVAVWIKSAASKNSCVVHWGASALGSRATFRMTPAKIRFEYSGGGITGATTINDEQWHHVAYTIKDNFVTIYVDGNVDATHAANSWFVNTGGTGNAGETEVEVGSQLGANFYSGAMDNVLIYDRALTAEEIATLAGL
ncbi:LamG-like jellyroll fold domain-containing protein [Aestuariivivens sp. NBU2969]|uniref:LamG-like jellyroll fold domain-containing protein n=1 Tax=Aestuariivivens sp. NBU2969 TaxID=2873267 RepID=UPI001CBF5A97|nr:LamG-like jellyroll fold domain-containing protein [Aestuariivivens sp. NBU2969]